MLTSLRVANLTLAFLIELAMLAAFAFAGWVGPEPIWLKFVLAIGWPLLAIVLWAVWAAPRAGQRRLNPPALTIFKILMFGAATAALWAAGQGWLAALFGLLAALNLVLAALFRQH